MTVALTNHVHAGTPEANTPEWQALYSNPEHVGATCLRCGSIVGDLTQHEKFHVDQDRAFATAGAMIGTIAGHTL